MTEKKKVEYDANSIVELDAATHLRKRPALTLGAETGDTHNPYSSMQRTCFREIYENSIDEALNGYADKLNVSIYKDHSFEVFDNGRGIPVGINSTTGKSGIMQAIGTLQSGRNFDSNDTKKSTGTNGLGASAVAVFSRRYDVTVYQKGKKHQLSFKGGKPGFFAVDDDPNSAFEPLEDLSFLKVSKDDRSPAEKKAWPTGTKTKVWLDTDAFPTNYPYDEQEIIDRLKGSAFLIPSLTISVYNEIKTIENPETHVEEPQTELFNFPDGLPQMVEHIMPDEALTSVIKFKSTATYTDKNIPVIQKDGSVKNEDLQREVPIEVAFAYGNGYEFTAKTFVNSVNTQLHGVHLVAFERAMANVLGNRFSSMRGLLTKADNMPVTEDYEEGLTLVISIFQNEPQFTSQSKEQLSGRTIQKTITDALEKEFETWITDKANTDALAMIAKKVTTASKNRQKAREQRDLNRKKNEISAAGLPIKLLDCEFAGTEDAELYICEGESAKSALKNARDGRIHALLPVKGKIINAHKETTKKVMANDEVQDIVKSLGAGFGSDFDLDKMRYGRVFIGTDADADGNAISCLIYALFWHLFKPVIMEGRLFKLETPLFVISTKEGKKSRKLYARDESERDKISRGLDGKNIKYAISRLKGLGEVMADDLETTAMNPDTRVITQITVDDVVKATEMLDIILGTDTGPRKHWIETSDIDEEALGE